MVDVDWLEVEGKGPTMLLQLPSTLDSHRRNNGRYHKIKTVYSSSIPTVRISVDSNHSISIRINLQQTICDPSRSSSMDPAMDNLLGIEESMIFNPTTTSSTEINHLWKDDPSLPKVTPS
jgi:hypothetical protein